MKVDPDPKHAGGVLVSGPQTYSVKETLKSKFAAKWNVGYKAWMIPVEHVEELQKFIATYTPASSAVAAAATVVPSAAAATPSAEVAAVSAEEKSRTLDDLLDTLSAKDVKELTTLTLDEIDYLITILKLDERAHSLTDPIDIAKIRLVIEELGAKLCRCIKDIMITGKTEPASIAICISSIFKKRGLKISTFQCKNGQLLLPKKGSKHVLFRQPEIETIIR